MRQGGMLITVQLGIHVKLASTEQLQSYMLIEIVGRPCSGCCKSQILKHLSN